MPLVERFERHYIKWHSPYTEPPNGRPRVLATLEAHGSSKLPLEWVSRELLRRAGLAEWPHGYSHYQDNWHRRVRSSRAARRRRLGGS